LIPFNQFSYLTDAVMKKKTQIQRFLLLIIAISFGFIINNKSIAEETPKKVKANLVVNGRAIAKNEFLNREDALISLNIQTADGVEKKELFVRDFDVALVRGGRKVANQTVFGKGSIDYLASIAKNEDIYVVEIKQIFEKTPAGTLVPYANGRLILNYTFFDFNIIKKN
jgi:hypothetical protein